MKRKKFNESEHVITEVVGEERTHTLQMMIDVFTRLIASNDRGTGFPIWGESKAKLMELAYVLAMERVFIHHPTGTPATIKDVAEMLCKALHCKVPKNIYEPASRVRRKGGKSIVDYYAKLWRENRSSPSSSLLWAEPIYFPQIKNYREAFDSPAFRRLHTRGRKRMK